jgi:Resolvase, N terminal domain
LAGRTVFSRNQKLGSARVSSRPFTKSCRSAALKAAGCQVIRAEKRSGTTTEGRDALRTVLEFLHAGDVLMVTRIDRLARSIGDLQDIVRTIRARGAVLKATEQPIDTGTAAGKCFLDMLGVFAEFETNLRRERQLEGIAKAAGVYKGRPPSIEASAQGMRALRHRQGAPDRPGVCISGAWPKCCPLMPFRGSFNSALDQPILIGQGGERARKSACTRARRAFIFWGGRHGAANYRFLGSAR